MANYTIFGGGPGGLYTAWRLITGGTLKANDNVEILEWGDYDYAGDGSGDRAPAGRICSYHYDKNPDQSYIEVGGMRFIEWDNEKATGHQLVSLTIDIIGLSTDVVEFNTTDNPLFYLRGQHFYSDELGKEVNGEIVKAPYATPGNNEKPADDLIGNISSLLTDGQAKTRVTQCEFYTNGTLSAKFDGGSYVYDGGENIGNVGYWNVFYDQAGNEGFQYAADAGGYSSNVINWNGANAAVYNGEFAPGGAFKTLKTGYSNLFVELFKTCQSQADSKQINFKLTKKKRLHSMWIDESGGTSQTCFQVSTAADPDKSDGITQTTDFAFLAMAPHSIELVARATRYQNLGNSALDFLNESNVQNYLQSVIEQPSYKVAMFFDTKWWEDPDVTYPPKLINKKHLDVNVFGPTITDLPLRQVYYFGNNATGNVPAGEEKYGILASYDDMRFTKFWQELELPVGARRETPISEDYQPLNGAGEASFTMMRMLKLQLAKVHFGDANSAGLIPDPVETVFMNWGLNPFGAGYHAWAAHYDICDVMQQVRTPGRMAGAKDSNIFVVGSAYSNDQAWVEGAFCTAESVLTEFLDIPTIAENTKDYPFICACEPSK
ncbi:MAG: hypothetical protein COB51_06720 [Moraxellaceae bacterium]|nr:MAG: hypothetical protein COB51_06720 [Moraxellaceae bacterium]